jgi:hypothetical protein
MATAADMVRSEEARAAARLQPAGGLLFDWAFSILSAWMVGGLYLDGWAHSHGKVDDVFFTPWHTVLYSGAFAIILLLSATYARNLMSGYAWPRLLPAGYGLSLAGAALFLIGGALDMAWHLAFGVEVNLEALLSPTHLLLASSGVLMVGGPLRAAWSRMPASAARGWRALGPLLLSAMLTLSLLTFFTQYGHPIAEPIAARGFVAHPTGFVRSLGISGIMLQSALLTGMILLLVRRWSLPFGALSLLIALNSSLMSVFQDTYHLLPAALIAGLLADVLLRWLKPAELRLSQLRLFAFGVPAVFYSLYFLALQLTGGIEWTIHLWMGAIFLAGVAGVFVSFMVAPPLASSPQRDVSIS